MNMLLNKVGLCRTSSNDQTLDFVCYVCSSYIVPEHKHKECSYRTYKFDVNTGMSYSVCDRCFRNI